MPTADSTTMNTPALLPCPFCGSTNNNSAEPNEWGVFYVECQDCGTRGPAKDYRCLEGSDIGRAKAITAWNHRSAGSSCPELKNLVAAIDAEFQPANQSGYFTVELCSAIDAARATANNPLTTHWQPLPSHPPFTPSEPHALTEGQRITVDGIRGPYTDLNGAYAVDSVNPGTITP